MLGYPHRSFGSDGTLIAMSVAITPSRIREFTENPISGFPILTQKLLFARGIQTAEEAERFLVPDYDRDLHDPYLATDMEKAVQRIVWAIESKERIVIFGDYDADGIPGASILSSLFKKIMYPNFSVYIPDRYEEKYGLSVFAIEKFAEEGTRVVITVDCGITDFLPAERARELGIDLIITDHHLPHAELPNAFAVINHKREGDLYPFKFLSGAGTAFKLAQALVRVPSLGIPPGWEKWLLDLVAIATICDMVPLVGENRALAHFGLRVLRQTRRPGLVTLFRKTRLDAATLTEDDIGFTIGPRINIASRMSHGKLALELLTTDNWAHARAIVDTLEKLNRERKGLVQSMIEEVKVFHEKDRPILFVGSNDWKVGIISAAANRLLEEYGRPVCLWTTNNRGEVKGSFRSDGSVSVLALFERAGGRGLFVDYGGHEHSGGFSVLPERLEELRDRLEGAYQELRKDVSRGDRMLESELSLADINFSSYKEIARFAPFGIENPKPHFVFPKVLINEIRTFGKNGNTHLELALVQGELGVRAVSFFAGPDSFGGVREGQVVSIVGTVEHNTWNGSSEIRLRILDIQPE